MEGKGRWGGGFTICGEASNWPVVHDAKYFERHSPWRV